MNRRYFLKLLAGILVGAAGLPGVARGEVIREFEVLMERYRYTPSLFRVKKGERVRFHLRSRDVMHGFHITGYELDAVVHPKKSATLEFTADRAGVFPVKCSVVCGNLHTIMQGKLVVEENYPYWVALLLGPAAAVLSLLRDD